MKKIGIIGSGSVGQTLASGLVKHGYTVMLGTRDTGKLSEWREQAGDRASVGDFAQTAKYGEILILAVAGRVAKNALKLAGEENLKGKTIIDVTNPIEEGAPENGVLRYFTEMNRSLMEELQEAFPTANFVKGFCQIGGAVMVDPDFNGVRPTMFICGNDEAAKGEAGAIIEKLGHEVEDMGKATAARPIESLAVLWCIPGFLKNQWTHAFKLLKKE